MKRSLDVVVLVVVLGVFLLLNALLLGRAAKVARRAEIVPVPSTYRTTVSGAKALYVLLQRLDVPVKRLLTRSTDLPADASVVVMLEPQITVTPPEALELRRWVDRGGTLILATEGVQGDLSPVRELAGPLFYRDENLGRERLARIQQLLRQRGEVEPYRDGDDLVWQVDRPNRYLAGVDRLSLAIGGSKVPSPAALTASLASLTDERHEWPVAGDEPVWLCAMTSIGAGRVLTLPSAAFFANGQLARGDNAVFAVNLIVSHRGDGVVYFDEYHLGHVGAENLWALLWRPPYRWLALQLLAALLVLAARAAIRFGPARDEPAERRRPAVEYVSSLAGLYRRAGARREAARLWLDDTRRRLCRSAGLSPNAPIERIAERVASRAGMPVGDAQAVLDNLAEAAEEGCTERTLLELARQADKLVRRVGGS